MKATFLLDLDVDSPDPVSLLREAETIFDDLDSAGHAVLSVRPWARHSAPTPLGAVLPTPPDASGQQQNQNKTTT